MILDGWDWVQKRMSHDFNDGVTNQTYFDSAWEPDGPDYIGINKTITLDNSDKIYMADPPNINKANGAVDSYETYNNFCDWITWGNQICCNTNNFWHWQGRWKTDQSPQVTFTDLGTGAIVLPDSPHYSPP